MKESTLRLLIREAIEQVFEAEIKYNVGDRVEIDSSENGGIGTVELASHPNYAIKFDQTGITDSYHFSDLRPFDDEEEAEKDKDIDTGLDESINSASSTSLGTQYPISILKYSKVVSLKSLLNESDFEKIFHIAGILLVDDSMRNQKDILSDVRSLPGITVVRNIEMKQDSTSRYFRSTIECKIDPYPFIKQNNFDSNTTIQNIITQIKSIKGVVGFRSTEAPYSTDN